MADIYTANRRFVDLVVRSRARFKALRDFTVDGALAELDRQTQERKDRAVGGLDGNTMRIMSRNGSIDSVRSPASTRSPNLANVPENEAFAIGGDDDDEDDDGDEREDRLNPTTSGASSTSVDDAVPVQSRSMSEKARGKQPVGQGSFSRSTSRNTSATSLPSLITSQTFNTTTSTSFTPTAAWVSHTCF